MIVDMGSWSNGKWEWNLSWRRAIFGWEEELLTEFRLVIDQIELRVDREDIWLWVYNFDGSYSSKSAYRQIQKLSQSLADQWEFSNNTFFESFWFNLVPLKVLTFSWQMILDRIPTLINLDRRNIAGLCPLLAKCQTTIHLLFTCNLSFLVWGKLYNLAGVSGNSTQ